MWCLDACGCCLLQNLSQLPNLRKASFVDNQISQVDALDGCTALEELSLEGNRLAGVEGLRGCTRCVL